MTEAERKLDDQIYEVLIDAGVSSNIAEKATTSLVRLILLREISS
jgi:hypothetical protein